MPDMDFRKTRKTFKIGHRVHCYSLFANSLTNYGIESKTKSDVSQKLFRISMSEV